MMYLVTMDTYDGYGSEIYVLGLYSSKEAAEKEACKFKEYAITCSIPDRHGKKYIDEEDLHLKITEIKENETYQVRTPVNPCIEDNLFVTDIYLGGYQE